MREIIAYYGNGTHDDELEEAYLCGANPSSPIALDDEFYVLPDWEYDENAEVEEFARTNGLSLDGALLGQFLADVLHVTRTQKPAATADDKLSAWNHFLEYDSFMEYGD
jgi:hypothetical protein